MTPRYTQTRAVDRCGNTTLGKGLGEEIHRPGFWEPGAVPGARRLRLVDPSAL